MDFFGVDDDEEPEDLHQEERNVNRNDFASKIFLTVTIQVLFIALVVFVLHYEDETREWLYDNQWFLWVNLTLSGFIDMLLGCCESVRRAFPCNMILLLLYTVCTAFFVAGIAARYNLKVVYLAFFATAIITFSMCLLARYGPFDVTGWGFALTVMLFALLIASVVVLILGFFMNVNFLRLILSTFGVVVASIFLVFVTQGILRKGFGDDMGDFIIAVISLETEIVSIFIDMLRIINACTHGSDISDKSDESDDD